jgi:hypothetical protein
VATLLLLSHTCMKFAKLMGWANHSNVARTWIEEMRIKKPKNGLAALAVGLYVVCGP